MRTATGTLVIDNGQLRITDDSAHQVVATHNPAVIRHSDRPLPSLHLVDDNVARQYELVVAHIDRRQGEAVELVGVEPDAHRILGAEYVEVPHPVDPAQRVLQV